MWSGEQGIIPLLRVILLGYRIPPIIIFSRRVNGKKRFEIIDGRQRYETIFRYMENRFPLTKKGLNVYIDLHKRRFNDLDDDIQDRLSEFNITLVKYSLPEGIEQDDENYVIRRYSKIQLRLLNKG